MYPYLTLQIIDHIPRLVYVPEEGMSRVMTDEEESLLEIIQKVTEELHFDNEIDLALETFIQDISNLAAEGDELYGEAYPKVSPSNRSFELRNSIESFLEQMIKNKEQFPEVKEMTAEVKNELNRNQNLDILAVVLDYVYYILINKTALLASELEVNSIKFEDQSKNLRLQKLIANEFETLPDIEFEIID